MIQRITTAFSQKEIAIILIALMLYENDLKIWESENSYKTIETVEIIKNKLNKKLAKKIKIKKIKEDNLPF